VQLSGWAFKGVRTLLSVQQITMKSSRRQSNTVWMLGQLVFNKELDFRSRHYWEVFASRPDNVATRLDDVQYFRIFQSSVRTRKGF